MESSLSYERYCKVKQRPHSRATWIDWRIEWCRDTEAEALISSFDDEWALDFKKDIKYDKEKEDR